MPIGNLTSQLFSNIYLNELDQFAKHKLKAKYYIRYADDFIFISENKEYLENIISEVEKFLESKLKLQLHPNKVLIKTLYSGVDFLGWVNFFDHRIIRGKTRERMFRRITNNFDKETLNSYLGLLRHGNSHKVIEQMLNLAILQNLYGYAIIEEIL